MRTVAIFVGLALTAAAATGCASISSRAALASGADSYNAKVTALINEIDALTVAAQALRLDPTFPKLQQRFTELNARRIASGLTGRTATTDFLALHASLSAEERTLADAFAKLAQRAAALDRQWKALDEQRRELERAQAEYRAGQNRWARLRAGVGLGTREGSATEQPDLPTLLIPTPPLLCRTQLFGEFLTTACG